jgi:hypothetical protein
MHLLFQLFEFKSGDHGCLKQGVKTFPIGTHVAHRLQIQMFVKELKEGQSWDRAVLKMDRGLYHLEKPYWTHPHTCYR